MTRSYRPQPVPMPRIQNPAGPTSGFEECKRQNNALSHFMSSWGQLKFDLSNERNQPSRTHATWTSVSLTETLASCTNPSNDFPRKLMAKRAWRWVRVGIDSGSLAWCQEIRYTWRIKLGGTQYWQQIKIVKTAIDSLYISIQKWVLVFSVRVVIAFVGSQICAEPTANLSFERLKEQHPIVGLARGGQYNEIYMVWVTFKIWGRQSIIYQCFDSQPTYTESIPECGFR